MWYISELTINRFLFQSWTKEEKEWTGKSSKIKLPIATQGEWPKLYCIVHELGLTIINFLISVFHYSANRISTGPSCVKCYWFLHFNFCNNGTQGRRMPSPYTGLFFVPATRSNFVFMLCWCPWITDDNAPGGWDEVAVRMLLACVVCLGCGSCSWHFFMVFFCVKEFSAGGICSSCAADVRKVSALWCFAAVFTCICYHYCVVTRWNIRVCLHIIHICMICA
jgi:hypothetical protein